MSLNTSIARDVCAQKVHDARKKEKFADTLSVYSARDSVWDGHRGDADEVGAIYATAEEFTKYAQRIDACAGRLGFAWLTDKGTGELSLKLRKAEFCRVRHCPICQWRRSLLWKFRFYQALPKIMNEHKAGRFIFVTLTVRNCDLGDLRATLKHMHEAWRNLVRRGEVKGVLLGFLRTTEVTRGKDGTAHPHYHVLVHVKSSYFKGTHYLKQDRWRELWSECLGVDYLPQVNVQAIKQGNEAEAAQEVLKYAVKPEDMKSGGDGEWLLELTRQVHKLRFIASGGSLKDALREGDESNEDLIATGEDQGDDDEDAPTLTFDWFASLRHYIRKR